MAADLADTVRDKLLRAWRRLRSWLRAARHGAARSRSALARLVRVLWSLFDRSRHTGRRVLAAFARVRARVPRRTRRVAPALPAAPEAEVDESADVRTVQIGRNDDIAAIRAKLSARPGGTVVARIHRRNPSLGSELGMRLLRRHVDATRIGLILETRSSKLRRLARKQGLLVVGSMRGREVRDGRLLPRYLRLGVVRVPLPAFGFVIRSLSLTALLLGAIVAAGLVAPSATIRLAPELTPVDIPLSVVARVVPEGEAPEEGVLPARRITVEVDARDALVSTGFVSVPDAPAGGSVRFANLTASQVDLPAGTLVSAGSGPSFGTLAPATLPAGEGAAVLVLVEAETPGPEANLAAGTPLVPSAEFIDRVSVTLPVSLTGGTVRRDRGAGPAQIDRLRDTSERILLNHGLRALEAQAQGRFTFHPASARLEVLREEFDPPLTEPADVVELTTVGLVSVVGVDLDEIRELAARRIRCERGSGFEVVRESLTASALGEATYDEALDQITFDMMVQGVVAATIVPQAVERAVRWERPGAAEELLNRSLTLRRPVQLEQTPGWMPLLPPFGFRIKVEILTVEPQPAEPG